jgi:SAM-dependent methyltransferase
MTEYLLKDLEARERLEALEALLDPGTTRLLVIGTSHGWHCLEVGGGAGSIAAWLCDRVGVSGRVVATDVDTHFLDTLESPNLEVHRHDIVNDELPDQVFDLVHVRAVLEHLPPHSRAIALERMVGALKSGGWLLAESGDYVSWTPADELSSDRGALFTKVSVAILQALPTDMFYGRRLAADFQTHGLVEVGGEGRLGLIRGGSTQSRICPLVWATIGERMAASGALAARELEDFIALHHDPDFTWLGPTLVAVWGRRPT